MSIMRGLIALAGLSGAAVITMDRYQPDFVDGGLVQPTAYQGASVDGDLSKRQVVNSAGTTVCDRPFDQPITYLSSGATAFLDAWLVANGTSDWLQAMSVATTAGFQPTPIDCGDLESDSCTPVTNCPDFTPEEFFIIRLAASNAQAYFRNAHEILQDVVISDGLQIDQVVADFGPDATKAPEDDSFLADVFKFFSPQLSMGDKVVKQFNGLGKIADSLGFVGAALNLAAAGIALGNAGSSTAPTVADVTTIAENALNTVFTGAQANIASLCSKLMGGSPRQVRRTYSTTKTRPDVDLDQVITTLTAAGDDILNDPVSSAKATQQISKIFNTGFFMLPLTDILTSDFNSSLTTGLNAGFQLIRQQTVMAVLAAQSYFVFIDTNRSEDDCNGITGSRFINNQCFTLEQRTPNFINCALDSKVIDPTIVLKLDSSSKPYGFDLPSFYQNVQACNNGNASTTADFQDDDRRVEPMPPLETIANP
ncbi:hypothetical protein LTR97_010000 [Elasticomyces elasticus]|uniref:Uncharacterized protein n=1 Tax=Elasticomyces elasticus TaxID=574655 RepID=A0AAN7VYR4_9PEZI|nr:hypothetical protein LTR97_010000 [Elasticomyces elasticus]